MIPTRLERASFEQILSLESLYHISIW